MRTLQVLGLIVAVMMSSGWTLAGEVLREISWSAVRAEVSKEQGFLPADDQTPFARVRIVNERAGPRTVQIAVIADPGITRATYAVVGKARTHEVAGKAYLEMWSHFQGGGAFFSRTLGEIGPMRDLSGSQDWREFALPFQSGDKAMRPSKLVVNVVFVGSGVVEIGPARLVEYDQAEDTLCELSWSQLAADSKLARGDVLAAGGEAPFERLRITNQDATARTIPVFEIEEPGITASSYAIVGRLRTQDLAGKGYLEMWSHFPGGERYFSRTLEETGPMGHLSGSQDWREFVLPFHIGDVPMRPDKLAVNVFFAGRGVVELSPLRLVQYERLEKALGEVTWVAPEPEERPAGEVVAPDEGTPFERLRVANDRTDPVTMPVLTIKDPGITKSVYAIVGKVRTEAVEGKSYLELLNYVGDGGPSFTRAIARSGPLKHLVGSSDWRYFALPFNLLDSPARPHKLKLNVVFKGSGAVELAGLQLVQYDRARDAYAVPGQWWSGGAGGIVGAVAGITLGCLGGLVGKLSSQGKSRELVEGILKGMVAVGVGAFALGVTALVDAQPYGVVFPLLLVGVLCGTVPLSTLRNVRRRYEELELRKIDSMDAA